MRVGQVYRWGREGLGPYGEATFSASFSSYSQT